MPAKLLILPNLLSDEASIDAFFPTSVHAAIKQIQGLIAESEKQARRYLRKFLSHDEMASMPLALLNEHTQDIKELLKPLERGETWGLISDAGLACIADPGSDLVWLAHQKKIAVETFVGPSSIVMALQLSGFGGQLFTFHGYLPREIPLLEDQLKEMEKRKGTHIWIEAPYRSAKMLEAAKKNLKGSTKLCICVNLTAPNERICSQEIADWKQRSFPLEKEPAVFLLYRE